MIRSVSIILCLLAISLLDSASVHCSVFTDLAAKLAVLSDTIHPEFHSLASNSTFLYVTFYNFGECVYHPASDEVFQFTSGERGSLPYPIPAPLGATCWSFTFAPNSTQVTINEYDGSCSSPTAEPANFPFDQCNNDPDFFGYPFTLSYKPPQPKEQIDQQ